MTYPVEEIPRLIGILESENLDFITTNRFAYLDRNVMSMRNRFGNTVLTMAARALFAVDLKDSQSGMWVFRKCLLPNIVVSSDSMAFSQELKIEACHFAHCRWTEVPIEYRPRIGKGKLNAWRDGLGNLTQLVRKRIRRGRPSMSRPKARDVISRSVCASDRTNEV
jgi:hypothetical protein